MPGPAGWTQRDRRDEAHPKEQWPRIREKLLAGDYRPAAVRAVDIVKPGGGTRRLGIPTVQDG